MPEVPHPDASISLGIVADESETSRKSIVSAMTKSLRGVRDSANAFAPLKSIAGHLYLILENCYEARRVSFFTIGLFSRIAH